MSEMQRPKNAAPIERAPSKEIMEQTGLIAFFARNGVAANLLMIFILVAGMLSFGTIVQEVFPEASLETVQVRVAYPGATPTEIEESIILKVEEAVGSIDGIKRIKSDAREGVGTVFVEMKTGSDIDRALDDVKAEISQIQSFPRQAEEPDIRELTTRQSVIRIAVYGDVSEAVLKEVARNLEDSLTALSQVSYVNTSSIRNYEVSIEVPQNTLQALGLSLLDIARTVSANSLDSPAGKIDTENAQIRIRTIGQKYSQQNFEDIILVSSETGSLVRLGQVASVKDGFEDNSLSSLYNGKPVAFVEVFRTSDDRMLDIAAAVSAELKLNFAAELPEGVSYAIWSDESGVFKERLDLLLKNALIGLFLVLVALTLFLDIRLAIWTAVGIAVAFIGGIYLLELSGSSLNMISLFGFIVAIGLVVDDAIVVGENIYTQREVGRTGLGAAISGARRVSVPVILALLTTVAAFSPLFAVGGVVGNLMADIPRVVIAVLAVSVVESLLILPNHLSHLPGPGVKSSNMILKFFEWLQAKVDKYYQAFVNGPLDKAIKFSVRMPLIIVSGAITILIIVGSFIPAGILKVGFFPSVEADVVIASLEMPVGTPVKETERVVRLIEEGGRKALAKLEGHQKSDVQSPLMGIYSVVGRAAVDMGPTEDGGEYATHLANVQFSFVSSDKRDLSASEFEKEWRKMIGPLPGVRSLNFAAELIVLGAPVNVQLSDPDADVVLAASKRVMEELDRFSGVFDILTDQDAGLQEIQLELKPASRTLGVTLEDVALQVRAAFFGSEALRIQRGPEDVRVYVRLPEDERNSIADVGRFKVRVPGGEVALSSLAHVSFGEAPSVIHRTNGRRVTTITADIDDSVVTGQEIAEALTREIMPRIQEDFPHLLYSFGGEQEEQAESSGNMLAAFLFALLAIYAILAVPFKSYSQPLIVMAIIPFGVIGALLGHVFLGLKLMVMSIFGIIALAGVIVNGSLVMIDFINENIKQGMSIEDAIVDGAKVRFRPVMLTSVTTFLGVVPITFETSAQAQFLIPMAASLGYGVLFGMFILQLLIPALAVIEYKGRRHVRSLVKKKYSGHI